MRCFRIKTDLKPEKEEGGTRGWRNLISRIHVIISMKMITRTGKVRKILVGIPESKSKMKKKGGGA